jgi:uncharacterized HAD superfamily protein
MDSAQLYDIDAAILDQHPRIKLRGKVFLLADLSTEDTLIAQRTIMHKQNQLAIEEEKFEEKVEKWLAKDEDDPDRPDLTMDQIKERREDFAQQLQEIIAEAAKMVLTRPVTDEDGEFVMNDEGRIKTESVSHEFAMSLSQQEWQALQNVAQNARGISIQVNPGKVQTGKM